MSHQSDNYAATYNPHPLRTGLVTMLAGLLFYSLIGWLWIIWIG